VAIALALASGSAEAVAQATTSPPPSTAAVRSPGSVGEIPPSGQWIWQETAYGGRYWAFVKPQDPRNFRHFGTPTGP